MTFGLGKPRRWLYIAFALGFAGLAVGGGVKGDTTVIALGAVFALATTALAVIAPRLAGRGGASPTERERYP